MEKRLSGTAMLFCLGFIFMLICAVGAFFFGIKIGSEKVETKYEMKMLGSSNAAASSTPYQQQDLVSFYHTVFLPYREFQNEWSSSISQLSSAETKELSSMFKNLSAFAKKKHAEAASVDMLKSPLLGEAQSAIIISLEQFEKASDKAAVSSKSLSPAELFKAIEKEQTYLSAVNQALVAQQAYYAAMLKWSASVNTDIPADFKFPNVLEISKWEKLPLTVKNKLMADHLLSRKQLTSYYPQDLTSRVDEFISSGQAAKMKIRTVTAVVELLIDTEAVRSGDFIEIKSKFYAKEELPLLPFFSVDVG